MMMRKILSFVLPLLLLQSCLHAQLSDMISVKKKNGRLAKTFVAGSPVEFITTNGNYVHGYINTIRNDSLFLVSYDIRPVLLDIGVRRMDTIGVYTSGFNYREIVSFKVSDRQRFTSATVDKLLMIGGAGYFLLNIINSGNHKESLTSSRNLRTLGLSAGAFGLGYFLSRNKRDTRYSGKRHQIVYVRLR